MTDMTSVIIPKSDQWNADDFISGPHTFKIEGVQIKAGQEQPVSITVEGSSKVYRPCKSMSRVLVSMWGADANKYTGRSLTLYRDPSVTWGGMAVGGIRISHMSDIAKDATMALTATKSTRKMYTVRPLLDDTGRTSAPAPEPQAADVDPQLITAGDAAAEGGRERLTIWWKGLQQDQREALGTARRNAWAQVATNADARLQTEGAA